MAVRISDGLNEDILDLIESNFGLLIINSVFSIKPGVDPMEIVFDFSLDEDGVFDLFESFSNLIFPFLVGVGEVGVEELSFYLDAILVAPQAEKPVHECFYWRHLGDGDLFF